MNTVVLLVSKEFHWIKSARAMINRSFALWGGEHRADFNILCLKDDLKAVQKGILEGMLYPERIHFVPIAPKLYPLNVKWPSLLKFGILECGILERYEKILYLDSDMYVLKDYSQVFDEIEGYDFGFTYHRKIGQYRDFIYQDCVGEVGSDCFERDLMNGGFVLINCKDREKILRRWEEVKEQSWIYDDSIRSDRGIWDQLVQGFRVKKFSHVKYDFSFRLVEKMSGYRNRDKYWDKYFRSASLLHFCWDKIWDTERLEAWSSEKDLWKGNKRMVIMLMWLMASE